MVFFTENTWELKIKVVLMHQRKMFMRSNIILENTVAQGFDIFVVFLLDFVLSTVFRSRNVALN